MVLRDPADEGFLDRFEGLVGERLARVPLQHLTGRAPFRGLTLAVGPGVFVPRPETEVVAGLAIERGAGGRASTRSSSTCAPARGRSRSPSPTRCPVPRVHAVELTAGGARLGRAEPRGVGPGRGPAAR